MQEGKLVITPARKLLLATCIASAALLSGCSDSEAPKEKPAATQAEPEKGSAQKIIDAAREAREAEQAARQKAVEDQKAAAEKRIADEQAALKVNVLPDPGKAPEGANILDIATENEIVWVYQAKTDQPDAPEVVAKALHGHVSTHPDKEFNTVLRDFNSADRFKQRDGAAKIAEVISSRVAQRKDVTYISIAIPDDPSFTALKPYDFDQGGFPVDGKGLFSTGADRGWLEIQRGYRLMMANGPDLKLFSVPDEKLARMLEPRVQKGMNSGLMLVVSGHIHSTIFSPEKAEGSYREAWRGMEMKIHRVDLVDKRNPSKVHATIEL